MLVKELFKEYIESIPKELLSKIVKGLSCNTQNTEKGEVFFVMEGSSFDIFSFVKDVEDRVIFFVCDFKNEDKIRSIIRKKFVLLVKDIEKTFREKVNIFYSLPSGIKYIGITGTNGKSTTAYAIYSFLKYLSERSVLLGTVKYFFPDRIINAVHTTPDFLTLRKMINTVENSVKYLIMEVSSHGIKQKRIEGIPFFLCLFTNLTRDHLDYHKSMEEYFSVKKSFFLDNPSAYHIINKDCVYGRKIFKELVYKDRRFSFGLNKRFDFFVDNIRFSKLGTSFQFNIRRENKSIKYSMPLIGLHNVYNIGSALSSLYIMGKDILELRNYLKDFQNIEGRLEKVGNTHIYIDYAHTPDGLRVAIKSLQDAGFKRTILVFGCGGNRDKGKRKIMGKVADKMAFYSFITSDNPRDEDPEDIVKDIIKGFSSSGNYKVVLDRYEAIKLGIEKMRKYKNCALLIAGKGHEDYQIIKGKKFPFKDRKVVEEILGQ